jgi:hypothetical protein
MKELNASELVETIFKNSVRTSKKKRNSPLQSANGCYCFRKSLLQHRQQAKLH